ncbi:Diaminopimelate decarboxylase [Candidatus Magnetomorum sp. HK-1]|nr:Diaminopimelate decarboxylase [Candidatus Magnetomorum sp. HK-1]
MKQKLPFDLAMIKELIKTYPTPFHIYDESGIKSAARQLIDAFSWNKGFKEYFAVKATPNPKIIQSLLEEGCGTDCSSMAELILSERIGIVGENIMFSSNDTPADEFKKARELGSIINLDDVKHIDYIEKHAGLPELICFRYNPGPLREGNFIIGKPEEAKYGFTREQLFEGYSRLKNQGIKRFGLHTMVASNELNLNFFVDTARMLFELAVEINKKLDIQLEFVNMGGGIGIPYLPDQKQVDLSLLSQKIQTAYDELIVKNKIHPLKLFFECGRMITGPHGYLVSTVLHIKEIYKTYAGLDACMANLMRPALYGAYHHITVLGKENEPLEHVFDVTGSLCENNDKFAIDRNLPKIEPGDILVIHDAGAHGYAMGFNYNGKLRSSELMLKTDGTVELIRRAETLDDYFATMIF